MFPELHRTTPERDVSGTSPYSTGKEMFPELHRTPPERDVSGTSPYSTGEKMFPELHRTTSGRGSEEPWLRRTRGWRE
jgi:hypothetical protein